MKFQNTPDFRAINVKSRFYERIYQHISTICQFER